MIWTGYKNINGSKCVEFQGVIGELLHEEPAAEVEDDLARDRRVPAVEVPLFQLLENLFEKTVHYHWQIGSTVRLAELVILLDLIYPVVQIQHEVLDESLSTLAQVRLDIQQKFAEDVVSESGVGVIKLELFLLFVFLPVVSNAFQIQLIIFAGLLYSFLDVLILVSEREQFVQVILQALYVLGVFPLLGLLCFFFLQLVGHVRTRVGNPVELGLSVVLGLYVSVQSWVTQVTFPAGAGEVTTILITAGPSSLLLFSLCVVVLKGGLSFGAQIRLSVSRTHYYQIIVDSNQEMLCFLGLRVLHPIGNRQRYREALQQIKHYLSLKSGLEVEDNEYILSVSSGDYGLSLSKHPYYLHSCHFNVPILNEKDFQFLDTAYECLMILREAFPSKIGIQLITDGEEKQIHGFEERKKEEFSRRVNASLKSMTDSKEDLTSDDVEDVIFLCANHYNRKNKTAALKLLLSRVSPSNLAYPGQLIQALQKMGEESQFRKMIIQLTTKIKALHRENELNKQNLMRPSNASRQSLQPETLKINPLIFQLKESYNIQRICLLLASALGKDNDRLFLQKLESSVALVANRFISDQYEEAGAFGLELSQLLKAFWQKRGKEWEQGQRETLERKVREASSCSRSTLNRSKLPQSRKIGS